MNKSLILILATALTLTACGGGTQSSDKDRQIAENQKEIELLKQQAEIQRLQNELKQPQAASASDAQVYQLVASEVASTIPQAAQANAKAGEIVQGTDGQQYTFDPDTGSWLLYGAIGAAAGYLAANAMNQRNAAKYAPVSKPTAAVTRVHNDYRAKYPEAPRATPSANNQQQGTSPRQAIAPTQNSAAQKSATPNYRPSNQGYSNTRPTSPQRSFGGRRKR